MTKPGIRDASRHEALYVKQFGAHASVYGFDMLFVPSG
jgi:hypothetical protein